MSIKQCLSMQECLQKVKLFKEKHNITLTDQEILNHYLEDVLSDSPSKYILNKERVIITSSTSNKEQLLKDTLNDNKVFIYEASGLKNDLRILRQIYLFREYAENYSEENGMGLDINETYRDDAFSFNCSLIIEKK